MEATSTAHSHHDHHDHHHDLPTEGRALTGVAVSATLHCLTGCAIGEVTGVAIGTALGWGDFETIALAVALAFLFGYALTSLPLLRAGLALAAVVPIALASDTVSIAVMEIVDNAIMLAIPGAMDSGLGDVLFWGALSFALAVAFVFALPVNRWLISRGKGHTAVHETGIHGGPSPRLVGTVLTVAAIFGSTVLIAEAIGGGGDEHTAGHDDRSATMPVDEHPAHGNEGTMGAGANDETVEGLTAAQDGLTLELSQAELPLDSPAELQFRVLGEGGQAITDFDVEHERRMHLIVVRKDLTGFQHLHPEMAEDGTWSTSLTLPEAGTHRVFADFKQGGESTTLGADLEVPGEVRYDELPAERNETQTASGYEVSIEGAASRAGAESELAFDVVRDGAPVAVEPYLGADGHLVALREGDLAFLHVHPLGGGDEHGGHGDRGGHGGAMPDDEAIRFATEFPTPGRYRLFLQFQHDGEVHTAEFTREVTE